MAPTALLIDPGMIGEYRRSLEVISSLAEADVRGLVAATADLDLPEANRIVREAYPEVWTPYGSAANDVSADFFSSLGDSPATYGGELPTTDTLQKQADWALAQPDREAALASNANRELYGSARKTVVYNANAEKTLYARHASANACRFCQVVATRGAVYSSEKAATKASNPQGKSRQGVAAKHKDQYHAHCHCIAVPVRPGKTYEPPEYVREWSKEYDAAAAATEGSKDMKSVMASFRQMDNPKNVTPTPGG